MIGKTVKKQVYQILSDCKDARNCDILLYRKILFKYYKDYIHKDEEGKWGISFFNMKKVPLQATIERWRRKIQNGDKKFLPTNSEVLVKRGFKTKLWLEELDYEKAG